MAQGTKDNATMKAAIVNTSGNSFTGTSVETITDVLPCTMETISQSGKLRTIVGSGVSVCLFDRANHTAGMNHFLFPRTDDPQKATGRFGNAALIGLHRLLATQCPVSLVAYVAGGAYCDEFEMDSALENIRIAWKFLFVYKIPVASQNIGGSHIREVLFDIASGVFTVKNCLPNGAQ